jgi:hypothetical protein
MINIYLTKYFYEDMKNVCLFPCNFHSPMVPRAFNIKLFTPVIKTSWSLLATYIVKTMLSITTFTILTLSVKGFYVTPSITDTQHYNALHYAE